MSSAWVDGLQIQKVGDSLAAIGHGASNPQPPEGAGFGRQVSQNQRYRAGSIWYASNRVREELPCPMVQKMFFTTSSLYSSRDTWRTHRGCRPAWRGQPFCSKWCSAHRCMKANDAATLIGDSSSTAANSPRSLGELGHLNIDRHVVLRLVTC